MAANKRVQHPVLYEIDWLQLLEKLIERAGKSEIFFRCTFAGVQLCATGCLLPVRERRIRILLCQQSPSDSANGVLTIDLPEEEFAQYWQFENEGGGMWLCLAYANLGGPVVEFEVATTSELLNSEENSPLLQ